MSPRKAKSKTTPPAEPVVHVRRIAPEELDELAAKIAAKIGAQLLPELAKILDHTRKHCAQLDEMLAIVSKCTGQFSAADVVALLATALVDQESSDPESGE